MKAIQLALNVCTGLGVFLVLFCVLAAAFIGSDIIKIKRETK